MGGINAYKQQREKRNNCYYRKSIVSVHDFLRYKLLVEPITRAVSV